MGAEARWITGVAAYLEEDPRVPVSVEERCEPGVALLTAMTDWEERPKGFTLPRGSSAGGLYGSVVLRT
jgi:hypothetical protein